MQVNLGKLLTGLGSGDLLHPQNSVLGATVSRAALYDSVQAENEALRSEVLELMHTLCVLHTASSFPQLASCLQLSDSRCSAALRGSTA